MAILPKKIILVDDHVVVRRGLKGLVEAMGPYKVIAEFDNGQDFLDAIPLKKDPDLIIMDLTMPVLSGDETMVKLREMNINFPVLVLTLNTADEIIIRMFKLGVRGYLEKDCSPETLKTAIEDVFRFGYYHNDLVMKALVAEERPKPANPKDEILKQMTKRELEFLTLVCDGYEYTYDQIASKMDVTIRTIDGYRESLFQKFDVKSKTGLVMFAIKNGICEL